MVPGAHRVRGDGRRARRCVPCRPAVRRPGVGHRGGPAGRQGTARGVRSRAARGRRPGWRWSGPGRTSSAASSGRTRAASVRAGRPRADSACAAGRSGRARSRASGVWASRKSAAAQPGRVERVARRAPWAAARSRSGRRRAARGDRAVLAARSPTLTSRPPARTSAPGANGRSARARSGPRAAGARRRREQPGRSGPAGTRRRPRWPYRPPTRCAASSTMTRSPAPVRWWAAASPATAGPDDDYVGLRCVRTARACGAVGHVPLPRLGHATAGCGRRRAWPPT